MCLQKKENNKKVFQENVSGFCLKSQEEKLN